MKFSYNQIPLFRLIIPFILGIVFSIFRLETLSAIPEIGIILSAVAIVFLALTIATRKLKFKWRWAQGTVVSVLLFTIGIGLVLVKTEALKENHISKLPRGKYRFLAEVIDNPSEKERSIKVLTEIRGIFEGGSMVKKSGRALLYFEKDSSARNIEYGDNLLATAYFNPLDGPKNPGQFNYKRYLVFHQIHRQSYVQSGDWRKAKVKTGNPVLAFTRGLRIKMMEVLQEKGLKDDEFAVASALILGYKEALDGETVRAYASAGAMHVLAVSGLHVGIIYLILNYMLQFLNRIRFGNAIKAVLLIALLCFYAMLTGLSPSVMRAATMFTFIIIAQSFKAHTNIYNTLAVSAFVLLLYDPYIIMQVGFQLSYLAVIGIVYIQPKIYDLWTAPNRVLDWVWQITCVSIAAQLATFPLGLLYFHQFPNYFFFSNLVVIPAATLILYFGISVFVTSAIPIISDILAWILDKIIWVLNSVVRFIEGLPYSISGGIDINILETWMIYSFIILFLVWLASKKIRWLYAMCSFSIVFFGFQFKENYSQVGQSRFVVYNVPKTSAYNFISGKKNYFLAPKDLTEDEEQMLFHVKHHWWKVGLSENRLLDIGKSEFKNHELFRSDDFIQFQDLRIALVDGHFDNYSKAGDKLKVDFVILQNDAPVEIGKLSEHFDFRQLIFDTSNSYYTCKDWRERCEGLDISFYDVNGKGAFVWDVKK